MKSTLLLKNILTTFLGIFLSLIVIEIILRILGYTPWHYDKSNNPSIYRFDNELGWISKSGKFSMSVSKSNKDIFEMTIENDSSRKIYGNPAENKILFLGGSFTQGWGVNDNETFTNNVQKDFKNYQIKNFGQGGYGSVQSYLLLKRLYDEGAKPKLVVYSFIDHHEYRNVARGEWLRLLLKYSNSGHETPPRVPFATVGKNNLINFHKPVAYPMFPLRETLSLVNFLEFNYAKITTKRRKKMQKDVLRKLLLEMKKISDTTNSVFLFVNLKSEISEHENFLINHRINYVDCNIKLSEDTLLDGDYHPNVKAHVLYSRCITSYLKRNNLLF